MAASVNLYRKIPNLDEGMLLKILKSLFKEAKDALESQNYSSLRRTEILRSFNSHYIIKHQLTT